MYVADTLFNFDLKCTLNEASTQMQLIKKKTQWEWEAKAQSLDQQQLTFKLSLSPPQLNVNVKQNQNKEPTKMALKEIFAQLKCN